MLQGPPANAPIIVKIVEPADDLGLADVLLGSFGLTGVITLLAVVCGLVLAGVFIWYRSRRPLS